MNPPPKNAPERGISYRHGRISLNYKVSIDPTMKNQCFLPDFRPLGGRKAE
jgi:hypothetical protein